MAKFQKFKSLKLVGTLVSLFVISACVSVQNSPLIAAPSKLTGGEKWLFEAQSPEGTMAPTDEIDIFVTDKGTRTKIGSGIFGLNHAMLIRGQYKQKAIQAECRKHWDASFTKYKCTIYIDGEKGPKLRVTAVTASLG